MSNSLRRGVTLSSLRHSAGAWDGEAPRTNCRTLSQGSRSCQSASTRKARRELGTVKRAIPRQEHLQRTSSVCLPGGREATAAALSLTRWIKSDPSWPPGGLVVVSRPGTEIVPKRGFERGEPPSAEHRLHADSSTPMVDRGRESGVHSLGVEPLTDSGRAAGIASSGPPGVARMALAGALSEGLRHRWSAAGGTGSELGTESAACHRQAVGRGEGGLLGFA